MSSPTESLLASQIENACLLLMECLNNDELWSKEALVQRLEAVFLALGGTIDVGDAHV